MDPLLMKDPQDDRRLSPRFPMRLPVTVNRCDGQAMAASTFSRDVSSGGIYFFLDSAVQAGAHLEFIVSLPPADTLSPAIRANYSGKVIRCSALQDGAYGIAVSMKWNGYMYEA